MKKNYKSKVMNLHRYVFYVLIVVLGPAVTYAQKLQVKSFEVLNRDLTARTQRVNDKSGNMCAAIKVALPIEGCKFEGNVIQQSYDVNEYLIYMPEGSKLLQLKCSGFETLQVELITTEGVIGVEAGVTYGLKLSGYENNDSINLDANNLHRLHNEMVEQENPVAQYNIGESYYNGKDYKEAVKWYRKSAEQGYVFAQYNLGTCYENGQGVTQDYIEAVKWYRKSAEQGCAPAQYNLGLCYYFGQGVIQDYTEAVKWYCKSAEQGNAFAQYNLGVCYFHGQGVTQDYTEAVKWVRKSAEQGYAPAQVNLGGSYFQGYGVSQDYKEAVKWFRKAAEQGESMGQCNLGICYFQGQGVSQDYKEAAKWLRKSAKQGNTLAIDTYKKLKSVRRKAMFGAVLGGMSFSIK